MSSPGLRRRLENRAKHWAAREAAASTPEEKAAVMYDACRMVATNKSMAGRPEVWNELAAHLAAFYRQHSA